MYKHTKFFGVLLAFSSIILLAGAQTSSQTSFRSSSPNSNYRTEKYNYSISFRQNFCYLQQEIDDNEVKFQDALSGKELRIIALKGDYFRYDSVSGKLDEDYGGIIVEIMDELAKRANFTWRDSFAVTDDDVENRTFTDLLNWTISTYDMSLDWWTVNRERISMGITFPEGWYDSTIIMVAKDDPAPRTVSLWKWTEPFSFNAWLMIVGTIISSGIVYCLLESIDKHSDAQELEKGFVHNIFLSGVNFTTHFFFEPRTNPTRLFTWSLSFWGMIVGATYTANLASFMVLKETSALQVRTLDEAINSKMSLCIYDGTATEETIYDRFGPKDKLKSTIEECGTEEEQFQGLESEKCRLAITTRSSWENWKYKNGNDGKACDLEKIGEDYRAFPAGFATVSDSGTKCTSLITDVVNYWMYELKEEGFIDKAWLHHLEHFGGENCAEEKPTDSSQSVDTLDAKSMFGIFAFHALLSALSIIMALIYKCTGWDKIPRFSKAGPGSRQSVQRMIEERQKAGAELNQRELILLKASRRQKSVSALLQGKWKKPHTDSASSFTENVVSERINSNKARSVASSFLGGAAWSEDDEEYDAVPDIRGESELHQFLHSNRGDQFWKSNRSDLSPSMASTGMEDQIAKLSSSANEQRQSIVDVQRQIQSLMGMMKTMNEKLPTINEKLP